MKQQVPIIIGLVFGMFVIVSMFVTGVPFLEQTKDVLNDWFLIAQAWAVAVGVVNLTQIHMRNVNMKRENYGFSIWLIICMYGMAIFGIFIAKSPNHEGWKLMYNDIIAPMNATVYATLVFYIGSAAYRAFRIRSAEAAVLLVSALIMMLGSVPLGTMIFGEWIADAATWILEVPNSAAMRGIQVGATLGAVATALRILLGIERGHLGGVGE
ncbi:MAG: hypothetical protein WBJ74_06320 [Bacillota bacterium]|nr:hypothetical protein [Bacillota bacterium]HPV12699.1 hypothetical protein [Bacillota bacterium]HPZ78206.1 hypothetical protein [Bacillota bacterium]